MMQTLARNRWLRRKNGRPLEELLQEARIGLWKAVESCPLNIENFPAYATKLIQREFQTADRLEDHLKLEHRRDVKNGLMPPVAKPVSLKAFNGCASPKSPGFEFREWLTANINEADVEVMFLVFAEGLTVKEAAEALQMGLREAKYSVERSMKTIAKMGREEALAVLL